MSGLKGMLAEKTLVCIHKMNMITNEAVHVPHAPTSELHLHAGG
jgi:hypothetical protein